MVDIHSGKQAYQVREIPNIGFVRSEHKIADGLIKTKNLIRTIHLLTLWETHSEIRTMDCSATISMLNHSLIDEPRQSCLTDQIERFIKSYAIATCRSKNSDKSLSNLK